MLNKQNNLKSINTGIVAESPDDIEVCIAYGNKILEPLGLTLQVYKENKYDLGTQINTHHLKKINDFFISPKQKPKFIILFTDRDKKVKLRKDLESVFHELIFPYVLVIVEEKLEDWLVSDLKAVNKALNLKINHQPNKVDTKKWLGEKIKISSLKLASPYKRIAQNSDISRIKNGFVEFYKDLRAIVQPKRVNKSKIKIKKMRFKVKRQYEIERRRHPRSWKERRRK